MSRIRTRMASPGCVPSIATGPVAPFTRSICRWSSVSSSDRICAPHESWQTTSTVSPDRTVATGSRCGPKTYVMPSSNDICLIDRPTVPWNRVELCYGSSQRSFEDVPSIEGGRRGPDASGRGQGNHGRGAAAQHSPASARSGRDSSSLRGPGAGDGAFEPPWGCRGPLLRPRLRRIRCGESEGPDLAGRSVWPHVESAGDAFPRQGPPAVRPSVDGVRCGRVLRPPGVQSHDRSRSARARLSGGGFADLAACGPPAIEDSIHQNTEEDLKDVVLLLLENEPSPRDAARGIGMARITETLAEDWGFWKDGTANLEAVQSASGRYGEAGLLQPAEVERVSRHVATLLEAIQKAPKSRSWRRGERRLSGRQWWNDVESVVR